MTRLFIVAFFGLLLGACGSDGPPLVAQDVLDPMFDQHNGDALISHASEEV